MGSKRTKTWIIILAVLTAAALVYTFAGASAIKATADIVEYEQIASYGDPAAAEGIDVVFSNSAWSRINRGRVTWYTDMNVSGGKEQFSVTHRYSEGDYSPYYTGPDEDVTVYISLGICPELQDLADREAQDLAVGESKRIEILVSDHVATYPVIVNYTVDHRSFDSLHRYDPENKTTVTEEEAGKVLRDLFKVHVPKDMRASIRITRVPDIDGKVSANYIIDESVYTGGTIWWDMSIAGGSYYDGAIYIYDYFSGEYQLGNNFKVADPRVIKVPVKTVKTHDGGYYCELEADKITVGADLEKGIDMLGLARTKDGSKALMPVRVNDLLKVLVVDLAGGGTIQNIDLCNVSSGNVCRVKFKDDSAFVGVDREGWFAVYPKGSAYELFFAPTDGSVESSEVWRSRTWYTDSFDASFEDGKLVIAGFAGEKRSNIVDGQTYDVFSPDGISLAVYTGDGLKYFTRYHSSLYGVNYATFGDSMCSAEIH